MNFSSQHKAFSMVEIVLALGIVAFALLALIALLPTGIKSNQISTEETQAASILTMMEADLRNTHPSANYGKSQLFGLTLPYSMDANNRTVLCTTLATNTISSLYSVGVLNDGSSVAYTSVTPRPRYQASVIYTQVSTGANSLTPVHARLIVNWPPVNATQPAQLTSLSSVRGFVEAYVTFSQP